MRALSLLLVAVASFATPATAQVALDNGTVTVIGTATVTAAPDRAVVRLGVTTRAASPSEALRAHEADVAAVLGVVRGFGIADRQITLERLVLGEDRREGEVVSMATRVIAVQTDDLRTVPDLVAGVVENGANRLDGLTYTIADPAPLHDRALNEAVARARTKAAQLASAAGLDVGSVLSMAEQGVGRVQPFSFGPALSEVIVRGDPGAYSAGESQVTASVVVRFALQAR